MAVAVKRYRPIPSLNRREVSTVSVVWLSSHYGFRQDCSLEAYKIAANAIEVEIVGKFKHLRAGSLECLQPDVVVIPLTFVDDRVKDREKNWILCCKQRGFRVLGIIEEGVSDSQLDAVLNLGINSLLSQPVDIISAIKATAEEGGSWVEPSLGVRLFGRYKSLRATWEKSTQIEGIRTRFSEEFAQRFCECDLTNRELVVLSLVADGHSNSQISQILGISVGTVKFHIRNISGKFMAENRTQLVVRALRAGRIS